MEYCTLCIVFTVVKLRVLFLSRQTAAVLYWNTYTIKIALQIIMKRIQKEGESIRISR